MMQRLLGLLPGSAAGGGAGQAAQREAAVAEEICDPGLDDLLRRAEAGRWDAVFGELDVRPEVAPACTAASPNTLLHLAVAQGNRSAVIRLVADCAVPPDLVNRLGQSGKDIAAASEQEGMVRLLQDITATSPQPAEGRATETSHRLLEEAKHDSWDAVYQALEDRPELASARPRERRFALLHHAAFWGNLEAAKRLVAFYDVPIGQLTKDGKTAAQIASEDQAASVAGRRGAACDCSDLQGRRREVADWLSSYETRCLNELLDLARDSGRSQERWDHILKEVDKRPKLMVMGRPPARKFALLHHAVYWDNLRAVRDIVEKYGVPPTLETGDGSTPLQVATEMGANTVADYLRQLAGVDAPLTFDGLCARSMKLPYFDDRGLPKANRLRQLGEHERQEAVDFAAGTRPVLHAGLRALLEEFLELKRAQGTGAERALLSGGGPATAEGLVARLLRRRPLMFMTEIDSYLLATGQHGHGGREFEAIGTDRERPPFVVRDYLSYDEMQLSAMVMVSAPCHFINDGSRSNEGRRAEMGTFERRGVFVAMVGARFERRGLMEWQHLVLERGQNTPDRGYGAGAHAGPRRDLLRAWARWYGLEYFPALDEVGGGAEPRGYGVSPSMRKFPRRHVKFTRAGDMLDLELYYRRMKPLAEAFLLEAQARAEEAAAAAGGSHKGAFCHVVGLGLGCWAVAAREQATVIVQTYLDALAELSLPFVRDVQFAWFPELMHDCLSYREAHPDNRAALALSKRNPADKLRGEDEGKLLVAQYAWDSNSYPGNEYWNGLLSASGDPAAACCSTIPELQNPEVNVDFPDRVRWRGSPAA